MGQSGIANVGSLGGEATCVDGACPTIVEGIVGAAAQFDGVDDCVLYEHVPELGSLGALSISAWVRRATIDTDYDCLLCKPAGKGAWNSWRLATYDSKMMTLLVDFRVGDGENNGGSITGDMALDAWVHAVGVWDGTKMVLWVDGQIVNELDNDIYVDDGQPVYLGCDDDHAIIGLTNFLTGTLDEVRFYDRAITADEIAALHAEGM
jgi:hypothetical protein